jgi:hypothetical protein
MFQMALPLSALTPGPGPGPAAAATVILDITVGPRAKQPPVRIIIRHTKVGISGVGVGVNVKVVVRQQLRPPPRA